MLCIGLQIDIVYICARENVCDLPSKLFFIGDSGKYGRKTRKYEKLDIKVATRIPFVL